MMRRCRCGKLIPRDMPACAKHMPRREMPRSEFYNDARWQALSRNHRREFPLCINYEYCRSLAQMVDHIIPINQGGECWDKGNLQSMCHRCHNRKRQKESVQARINRALIGQGES
jgi:5-methylcytosine-specific restriction protein A